VPPFALAFEVCPPNELPTSDPPYSHGLPYPRSAFMPAARKRRWEWSKGGVDAALEYHRVVASRHHQQGKPTATAASSPTD
jgi:hypothetical protein